MLTYADTFFLADGAGKATCYVSKCKKLKLWFFELTWKSRLEPGPLTLKGSFFIKGGPILSLQRNIPVGYDDDDEEEADEDYVEFEFVGDDEVYEAVYLWYELCFMILWWNGV